jgi:hypothetical protein
MLAHIALLKKYEKPTAAPCHAKACHMPLSSAWDPLRQLPDF